MTEEWRNIHGWDKYQVSNLGRVRSLKGCGRILKQSPFGKGYLRVCFSNGSGTQQCKAVHVLVMLAFVGPCPDEQQVLHWDGDKTNNRLTNLRYGTQSDNMRDSVRLGEIGHMKAVRRSDGKVFPGLKPAGRVMGVSSTSVRRAARTGGTCCGYKWEFV